jgi:hypothetical protein
LAWVGNVGDGIALSTPYGKGLADRQRVADFVALGLVDAECFDKMQDLVVLDEFRDRTLVESASKLYAGSND